MDTDDEAAGHAPRGHAIELERAVLAAGHDPRRSVADASASEKPDYTRDAAELSQSWATLLVVLMLVLGCVTLWLAMR